MKSRIPTYVAAAAFVAVCGLLSAQNLHAAPTYTITEVMSGLVTPRGLTFGPDGALYVAEAGNGGTGPSVIGGNGVTAFLGATSGLSRLSGSIQTRILSGLPSLATAAGLDAGGLQDIVFNSAGQAYGLFALGTSAAQRNSNLGVFGADLGTIMRLSLDGSGVRTRVADIAQYEFDNNPDGSAGRDSNPFRLAINSSGHFLVADAGGNNFLQATAAGVVSSLAVLPAKPNPLPFGPPFYQSVPTSITVGPDGAYYIAELTGFPFPAGAANVYRYDPVTGELTVAYSGFTNIIDITFDSEGDLLVLQLTSNGLASPIGPGSGLLLEIDALTGERTTIASEGLFFPGGLAIGPDGAVYVTNRSNVPMGGQVLRIATVPEPATWMLLAVGLAGAALSRRVASSRHRPC